MRFKDVPKMRESTLKRFLRMPGFDEHLELHRLDCVSSHGHLDNYHFAIEKLAAQPPAALKPPPLIRGEDLILEGYRPGPQFAKILTMIEDAQLEGSISSREEAILMVRNRFPVLQSN
jgi:poly(A) polymerase